MIMFICGVVLGWIIARGYTKLKSDIGLASRDVKSVLDRFSKKDE